MRVSGGIAMTPTEAQTLEQSALEVMTLEELATLEGELVDQIAAMKAQLVAVQERYRCKLAEDFT